MYPFHKIKPVAATLTVGFLLAIACAGPGQAANGTPRGTTSQEQQAVKARSAGWNRFYGLGVHSSAVPAAERRRAQAENRYYGTGALAGTGTTPELQALQARGDAWNRYYRLGAYGPTVRAAEQRRAQALNRFYRVGQYEVIRVPSRFVWSDAGIGAGAMLGVLLVFGGLAVALRRRTIGKASSPSTT
jgi:hypothetical protein